MDSDSSTDQNVAFHHGSSLEADDNSEEQTHSSAEHKAQSTDTDEQLKVTSQRRKPNYQPAAASDAASAGHRFNAGEETHVVPRPIRPDTLAPSTASPPAAPSDASRNSLTEVEALELTGLAPRRQGTIERADGQ